jgi:ornithine cyclodeaminase/alanine dehydrogenase-like protein (mu-crystallin family)
MSAVYPDVLFVSYEDTLQLLSVEDALRICEDVYAMHMRGSVVWAMPPSFKLNVGQPYHNHWHVKGVFLKEIPTTGVRLYNYFDDGVRTTVGQLERLGYVQLCDPTTSYPLAIIDEHWSYAIRSAAAAVLPCKLLATRLPRVLCLLGVGTMSKNALRCLLRYYRFDELRCVSRRVETGNVMAAKWSSELGITVRRYDAVEEAVQSADIVVGGASADILCRGKWLKPGCTFISLSPRQLDPDDWSQMDKVVVDSWEWSSLNPTFQSIIDCGQFSRSQLHAEIHQVLGGAIPGRSSAAERILIHTAGLVSQDVAIAHHLFVKAKENRVGIWLPAARTPLGGDRQYE